jgi:hypothetical protein
LLDAKEVTFEGSLQDSLSADVEIAFHRAFAGLIHCGNRGTRVRNSGFCQEVRPSLLGLSHRLADLE